MPCEDSHFIIAAPTTTPAQDVGSAAAEMVGTPKHYTSGAKLEGAASEFWMKPPSTTACFTRRVWARNPAPTARRPPPRLCGGNPRRTATGAAAKMARRRQCRGSLACRKARGKGMLGFCAALAMAGVAIESKRYFAGELHVEVEQEGQTHRRLQIVEDAHESNCRAASPRLDRRGAGLDRFGRTNCRDITG